MKRPRQCSFCGQSAAYKPTSVYARWYPLDTGSKGYLVKLCDPCFQSLLTPAIADVLGMAPEDVHCPMCKDPEPDEVLWTWLHVYPRKTEEQSFEVPLCEPCVTSFRQPLIDYGEELKDRAPAREDVALDAWRSLGIHPVAAT